MIYFCIDGGGSKTAIRIYEDDKLLLEERGESTSLYISEERAKRNLLDLLERSFKSLNLNLLGNFKGCFGTAGFKKEIFEDFFKKNMPNSKIYIDSDANICLGKYNRSVFIAGTGSIIVAKDNDNSYRMAGRGYILSDEGSGFYIAKRIIKRVVDMLEDRIKRDDDLIKVVLDYFSVSSLDDLIYKFYNNFDKTFIAALNKNLDLIKDNKNVREVFKESAAKLEGIARDFYKNHPALLNYPLILTGSIFIKNSILREDFIKRISDLKLDIRIDKDIALNSGFEIAKSLT